MKTNKILRAVTAATFIGASLMATSAASAAPLTNLSVTPSDPRPSATAVEYAFTLASATTAGTSCVKFTFNTTSNFTGTYPAGMNATGVTLDVAKSTILTTPASWSATSIAGGFQVADAGGGSLASSAGNIVVDNIVNASAAGSYYVNVESFTSDNCTTGALDNGQTVLVISDGVVASVDVDPTFTFVVNAQPASTVCAGSTSTVASTSSSVPFGKVIAGDFGMTVQQARVSSNAPGGYKIYLRSSGVMTAPGGTIPDFASSTPGAFPALGTAAFGYTSGDTELASPFGSGQFAGNLATVAAPGHTVASGPANVTFTADNTCVGYRVNIAETTKSGTYVTNLIYTAVPTF